MDEVTNLLTIGRDACLASVVPPPVRKREGDQARERDGRFVPRAHDAQAREEWR